MAGPNILESYLVSLSMKGPSAAEQREAEKAFSALADAVAVIVPTITAAATAIVFATDKIASSLAKLSYEAQKTKVTVDALDAAGKAMVQSGTTLEKFTADFDKFSEKLRLFPQYKDVLKKQLGLTDEDFKDAQTAHSAYLKAMAERRKHGDMQVGMLELMGTDEDVILARGRATYDPYFKKQMERNKDLGVQAEKAVALVRALNDFGNALEAIERKAAAALFDKYGIVLNDMTKWVDDHSTEIIGAVTETVDQLVLAWKDIEPVAVPAMHLIAAGLDRTATVLDRLLGAPDGQHGGLHAVRYVLDDLAVYIAGKWMLRLLGLLGLRGIGGAVLGTLGIGGAAAVAGAGAAAYGVLSNVPKAEGDDSYGLDHPGWHPGMPKEKTRTQKERDAEAPPPQPEGKTGYHGEPGLGMPGQAHGETMVETTDSHGHSYVINKKHVEQFNSFLNDLQEHGYKVKTVGGFEDRANANDPGKLSTHARGKAIDINADQNPNQRTLKTDMPSGISELAHKHGLKWGGDFKGTKDPMHFEIENEKQSFLAGAHHMLAAVHRNPQVLAALTTNNKIMYGQWSRTNNIGTRKQVTNIQLASTDPHTAASEIARHMKGIHEGTLRSLDRLA